MSVARRMVHQLIVLRLLAAHVFAQQKSRTSLTVVPSRPSGILTSVLFAPDQFLPISGIQDFWRKRIALEISRDISLSCRLFPDVSGHLIQRKTHISSFGNLRHVRREPHGGIALLRRERRLNDPHRSSRRNGSDRASRRAHRCVRK
jgi:hypothetical protein